MPYASTFHVVLCLLYTYWDIHHFGGLFILNLSKMLKFAATQSLTAKWQRKQSISFLVKTFVKNIMTVRIWGNPRTIRNLNCLFSMHNWKWVNLSKIAGFNISLSLNKGKVAPITSTWKAYVSFCFSLSAVVSPALYRFLYRQWNKRNYSTPFPKCFSFF